MTQKFSSLSDLAAAFGKAPIKEQHEAKDENLVYKTGIGRVKQPKKTECITATDGFARVRRETKGRKGKGVITITGLGLDKKALKALAKKLKTICGSGGTVVEETIEIQGDKRELIKQTLEKEGFKVKFIGG